MKRLERIILAGTGTGSQTYTMAASGYYISIINTGSSDLTLQINADGVNITVPGASTWDAEYDKITRVQITATEKWAVTVGA